MATSLGMYENIVPLVAPVDGTTDNTEIHQEGCPVRAREVEVQRGGASGRAVNRRNQRNDILIHTERSSHFSSSLCRGSGQGDERAAGRAALVRGQRGAANGRTVNAVDPAERTFVGGELDVDR